MKRLLVLLSLLCTPAYAGCNVGALPFIFQNNTVADATQVNADFAQIVNNLATNCAASGANSDITSLNSLSTPISAAQGGASFFAAGTSTGTNALVITTTLPTIGWSLTAGFKVSFTAGASNTAATTANVNGTGVINVLRQTQVGAVAMIGGEIITGMRETLEYDGANFQLINRGLIYVGQVFDHAAATCPVGSINANSQAISRSTFSALFGVIGTTWGVGDGSTTYNVPDLRNRATYGQDQNVGGLSNRITVAGSNFDGTVLGNTGGLQNSTSVGPHTHTITDVQHQHTYNGAAVAGFSVTGPGANTPAVVSAQSTGASFTGITGTNSTGAAYSILAPAAIVSKCIQG